jgi:hypothetical protein
MLFFFFLLFSLLHLDHSLDMSMQDQVIGALTQREDNEVMALLFHPQEQILLSSDINGCVHFNLFDLDSNTVSFPEGLAQNPFTPHAKGSCRTIDMLVSSSDWMVTGGSDGRVVISSFDPKVVSKYQFENPINVVKSLTETLLVAGDDEGALLGIDLRQKKKAFSIHEQSDYISSICSALPSQSPLKAIIATSGDTTLAVYDLRAVTTSDETKRKKDRLVAMSDRQEDELNCCIVLNQEQNVLTGDANGVVGIWKQGFWGDLKDRVPLYQGSEASKSGMDGSHSIEGMKKLSEKEYLVVTSDGVIRQVNLFPNEVARIIGVHANADETQVASISAFDCDIDLGIVATSSGDSQGRIKFWSLNNSSSKDDEQSDTGKPPLKPKNKIQTSAAKASRQSFFNDL